MKIKNIYGKVLFVDNNDVMRDCILNAVKRRANLRGANLSGANLSGAYLSGATGNNERIKTIQSGKYVINHYDDRLQIGCKDHSVKEWFNFSDETIKNMDEGALDWWGIWKPIIKQILEIKND